MNPLHNAQSRPRALFAIVIGLVAGHVVFFYHLPRSVMSRLEVPGAVVAGVVLLVIAKHLGVFALLFRRLHARLRRRY